MSTHEPKPGKSGLERVICRLSIKTAQIGDLGGRGEPEFTTADIAAAVAGLDDPIGEHLIGVLKGDARSVDQCLIALHRAGWMRWLDDGRHSNIDTALHRRMCEAAIGEYQQPTGWKVVALQNYLRVGKDRLRSLMPHYLTLVRMLMDSSERLGRHVSQRLKRNDA